MTIKIGFQLVPQHGSYETMRTQWSVAEELGVDALYTADHFFAQDKTAEKVHSDGAYPDAVAGENFEAMSLQAAMAATTTRPAVGCIVHSIGYRNPNLLADMARTIDHISGGRFMLGLGSGYQQRDYEEYGYEWGTMKSRMLDLQRCLPIIKDRFTKLTPPPVHKIPIMIGSMGEGLGLRLVAEHADQWHAFGPVEKLAHKIGVLRQRCEEVGRDFDEIELSVWHWPNLSGEEVDPIEYIKLGFRHIIMIEHGPWDLGLLREMLTWRDALNRSEGDAAGLTTGTAEVTR